METWDTIHLWAQLKLKQTLTTPRVEQGSRATGTLAGGNAKWYSYSGKVWQFLIKLSIIYISSILFLGIYPREMNFMFMHKPVQ